MKEIRRLWKYVRYVAVAIAVCVILATFWIYYDKFGNWKVLLLGFWLVVPPLFSWFEYHCREHISINATDDNAKDDFTKKLRDSQDASAKVWAGFGALFILII
jgi:hypothetical protein